MKDDNDITLISVNFTFYNFTIYAKFSVINLAFFYESQN